MKVCIAEKPSVASEIAKIIGAKSRKDGYFEGNGYAVTWTFGHLCTLKLPDDYKAEWKSWRLEYLPMLPEKFEIKTIKNKGVAKQLATIKKLFKQADVVINCGDAGQEGELIQRWVMQHSKYKGKVLRLWISSLTPEAIRDGFKNLKNATEFDNLYYAGMSRAIGDWILGMNATRLFTLKYGGYKQVLSVGRVQTPTLAMLVERFKEIENFKPEPFWELQTLYREVAFNYEKGRFLKKEDGEVLLKKIEGKPFTIVSFTKKKGKEYHPPLFDLTSLQVHCNKRFGYTADQTLKIVQKLYEQKVVTYPRVDTTYLPNDVYPKVPGILQKMTQYSQFTQSLLGTKLRKSSKVFNDKKVTDHHAIIPTGFEKNLLGENKNVYDAIARRFIAAFYPDCIVSKTTVIGESEGVRFKATGKVILEEGWRVLFPKPAKKAIPQNPLKPNQKGKKQKEEEKIMPAFKAGETGPHQPELVEKMTQPPKHYTEATLLRGMETAGKKVDNDELRELMKANGIGRPSTRANIIETLFRRKYIERKRKQIHATAMGIQLIETIDNDLLKSAELTGQWEKQLREMAEGSYAPQKFVHDMKNMVTQLVDEVKKAAFRPKLTAPDKSFSKKGTGKKSTITQKINRKGKSANRNGKAASLTEANCPKCKQGKLLKGSTAYGCSRWQSGCGFRLPFVYKEKKISDNQLLRLINKGSTVQLKGFKDEGKVRAGKVLFNKDFELVFQAKVYQGGSKTTKSAAPIQSKRNQANKPATIPRKVSADSMSCPKCADGTVVKGSTAYGCSRWQSGCDFRFSFEEVKERLNGRVVTKAVVMEILRT